MNGLCGAEELEGMVGRTDWVAACDTRLGGGCGGVSTSGGQCFDDHWSLGSVLCTKYTLVCRRTHSWLSFNVIRVRVISSTSLLIVQTKMSKTNGSYLIICVKDEQQGGFAERQFVATSHSLVAFFH